MRILISFSEFKQEFKQEENPVVYSSFVVFVGLIGLLLVGLVASIISAFQLSGIDVNATVATVVLLAVAVIFLLVSVVGLSLAIFAIRLTDE